MSETVCWCGSGKPYEDCHKEIEDEIRLHQLAGEDAGTDCRDPGSVQIKHRCSG